MVNNLDSLATRTEAAAGSENKGTALTDLEKAKKLVEDLTKAVETAGGRLFRPAADFLAEYSSATNDLNRILAVLPDKGVGLLGASSDEITTIINGVAKAYDTYSKIQSTLGSSFNKVEDIFKPLREANTILTAYVSELTKLGIDLSIKSVVDRAISDLADNVKAYNTELNKYTTATTALSLAITKATELINSSIGTIADGSSRPNVKEDGKPVLSSYKTSASVTDLPGPSPDGGSYGYVKGTMGWEGTFSDVRAAITEGLKGSPADLYAAVRKQGASSSQIDYIMGYAPGTALKWALDNGLPAFANGGMHTGGLALVGEKGPELVNMGPAQVFSNKASNDMFNNKELIEEIRQLRQEVAVLRYSSERTEQNTRKTRDTLTRVTRDGDSLLTSAA